jgi:hypothetical protein
LRKEAGLGARTSFKPKIDGEQDYMPKPDSTWVSGVHQARGYTYLNLGGGDSWGYWHPDDNFEFIHNFKGEPVYKTSELIPDYYQEKVKALRVKLTAGKNYYTFRDAPSDTYYAGWHDPTNNVCEFNPIATKQRIADFMKNFGLTMPTVIPEWTCTFNPHSVVQVNSEIKYWNRFVPSKYMLLPKSNERQHHFPTILALLHHVLGVAPEGGSIHPLVYSFLNWLAFAFQLRRNTGTAWILQGVPGTGKGLLLNFVIKALFGPQNYTARRMEELEDKFNGYLENCLICYIDEVHIGVSKRADMILSNLKTQITEPTITIRNMHKSAYVRENYLNWIFSSNMSVPITLDKEDRRFSVGGYQTVPIRDLYPNTLQLIEALTTEIADFGAYMHSFPVQPELVTLPVRNEARQDLIDNSKTSLDVVGEAILSGNLELLASFISTERDGMLQVKGDQYTNLIKEIAQHNPDKITRDELRTLFSYTVGDVPQSPAKFTRFMNHRGIKLKKIRVNDVTTTGMEITWHMTAELRQEILTGKAPPLLKVVSKP